MARKSTDPDTTAAPAATAIAEPVAQPVATSQDNNALTEQLKELQAKLSEAQATLESTEKAKNEATAKQLQYEAMYKGLQNQTTKTLQKAAEDRKILEQQRQDSAKMAQIEEALATITAHLLDDGERKELELRQRELKLKLAEQADSEARQRAQEQAVQATASPQSYSTLEDQKAQFVNYYYPGQGIDPNDSRIDWASDVVDNPAEALRRFTTSVGKIKDDQYQAKIQDVVAQLKTQNEETLRAHEAKIQELIAENAKSVEQAKVDAKEEARKSGEKRLRQLGADIPGSTSSDGTRRTLQQQMDEELPDDLAYKDPKEYQRRVERLSKQFRG